jgi:hypothetical protein
MRGADQRNDTLFSYVRPDSRIPANHPLRPIRRITDTALKSLSDRFDAMYSEIGRPSIPPEKLLRALLLQASHWFPLGRSRPPAALACFSPSSVRVSSGRSTPRPALRFLRGTSHTEGLSSWPSRVAKPAGAAFVLDGASNSQGLSTTLMQPSFLSRKVLYSSGPSSNLARWVMTNDGSISPF